MIVYLNIKRRTTFVRQSRYLILASLRAGHRRHEAAIELLGTGDDQVVLLTLTIENVSDGRDEVKNLRGDNWCRST